MATSSDGDSKRMYSWWWDSHISPKNSKWLQENLRDMDANVKAMIKLIEEDADSFAKRAELYFKKRPELMSLVEQFYRAYRALAERYDHATGVLHQAHRTMAEAFPGQVPLILPDDSIYTESTFAEEESDSLKGLNDILGPETPLKFVEDRVRKRLDFHEVEEKAQTSQSDEHHKAEAKEMDEFEKEIFILKEALAKLEADKETGFVRFQESLERLAKLESGFSEVQSLKEAITRIECEKEHSLLLYKQCLDRISNLENVLSYVQADAVKETRSLKQELAKLEAEKNDALDQQKRSLDMIHDLENKLRRTEDYAKDFSGKAAKAENEVEVLNQAIAKLTEHKISIAQEEVERLSGEINNGVSKLKNAEEQCFLLEKSNESLRFELKKLEQKMGCQKEELTEKQKELGRLWTCIQEERLCFVEAKTAFQTLQHLHSQAQDELRSLSSELENRTWILGEIEIRNQNFQEENTHLAAELESIRGKIKELESSCEYLAEEKSALLEENSSLLTQIQIMNEKNSVLENSVRDLSDDLEGLKTESKSLEDSYRLLLNQKAGLAIKNDNLISHLRDKEQRLKELQAFLDVEKRSQADFVQQRNKELEEEGEKLLEASKLLQKQVSELEQQNLELRKLEDVKTSLLKTEEENQKLAVEISVAVTLLEQVISEAKSIELEKNIIEQELALKTEQLFEMKKGLCAKVEGDRKGEEVCSQIDNLQRENSKILEEKVYLTKEISHSEEKNRLLEEENNLILIEKILISLVFENYVDEKSIRLKELGGDFEKQCDINKALTEKLNMMKKTLQMSEDTLRATEISRDQLILEYANRKDCFSQKEMQLLEAERKLNFTENEKRKLLNILEDQTRRFDEVKLTNENQEKQISCLCEDNDCLRYENVCLLEASQKLDAKLGQLHEEQEASKIQVETLLCELQEAKREIDICEKQAASSFCDLQVLNVYQDLFEEKVHELNEAIEGLEDERVLDIKLLNQRVGVLEGENEGLKAQLAAYSGQNLEIKDAEFVNDLHESHPIKDQNASAIEEAEIKMEHQNPTAVTKLDLKSESRSRRNVKPLYEISLSENGLLTKDIMLDQMSECSSHGITGNEHVCTDNHMLELWETTDDVSTIDLNVGKAKKDIGYRRIEPAKKSVSDFQLEKQLGVDSLEIARRSVDLRREANKKKIIDRLNCDVQRLTNLQITVQDLKRKLEITEKNRRGKAVIESDNLKTQLEEAEESIFRFLELNGKLMKNIEDGLFSSGGGRCSSMESEEGGSVRRRRVSEQARRVTEKIGRLQLEVQKMQFVLLKLEDGRENKAGAGAGRYRVAEAKRRVVLRDYLYSGGRTSSQRKKKAPFCACVDPPTNGD